jgi:hypothetical protein
MLAVTPNDFYDTELIFPATGELHEAPGGDQTAVVDHPECD